MGVCPTSWQLWLSSLFDSTALEKPWCWDIHQARGNIVWLTITVFLLIFCRCELLLMRNSIPMNTKPTLPPHTWKCSGKRSPTYSRVSLLFMSCCSDKIWQSSGKTHCWLNVWWSGFISGFNPKEYQMGASTCTCCKWINLWKWVLCSFWCPQVRLSRRWWLRRYWRCDV